MASNKVIPKSSLTAYERWELPVVGEPSGEDKPAEEVSEQARMPTAEEIAAIQEQAHQEAYQVGYAEGQKEGHEAGQKEGYEKGFEQGLADGQTIIQEKASQLQALMASLQEPYAELDEEVERELATLAMAVARHLVRRELKTDPGAVVGAVRQAVSALPSASRDIRVYLHPDDAALVREALSVSGDDGEQRWRIVEDPVLTRGGSQVESEFSRIDATVESRLAAIIAQALGGERDGDPD